MPSQPTPIQKNCFTLCGILLDDEASIILHYGYGSKVTKSTKILLNKKEAVKTNLVGIAWAQRYINELSVFPEKNREEIVVLGRQFSLVTLFTSLIVLEVIFSKKTLPNNFLDP